MAQGFSLKDQLFNTDSLSDLAAEYSAALPFFDGKAFHEEVVAGLQGRELLERLEWIADCVEKRLSADFCEMADQLEASLAPPLNPDLKDNDFGRFIHAVPGILAVRHGLENHRERALDLLHAATRRFSMEFYIRPFLNRWPDETLARLRDWSTDENYHVRRLVSEGTRPKLPWAKAITLDPILVLPFLDHLHADKTRYVTRSVANHLNDIAKIDADAVVAQLGKWHEQEKQSPAELIWMTRHALRTLVKQGHTGALALLGFHKNAPVSLTAFALKNTEVRIGSALELSVQLKADVDTPVIVDYLIRFHRPNGRAGQKVFKLKQGIVPTNSALDLKKRHVLKGNATTFKLHPGPHSLVIQVNGRLLGEVAFELLE